MNMNKKKKVGIMTMHKVLNYGSALQAYALQKKVLELGFDCEIIDYIFPNVEHLLYQNPNGMNAKDSFYSYLHPLLAYCKREIIGVNKSIAKKKSLFDEFYRENLILSPKSYPTRLSLEQDPPKYDIYLTGSDQVWNSKYIGYDTSFMFSFVKANNPRISYAASLSSDYIPEYYQFFYQRELMKYSEVSVREEKGISLVRNLVNKHAELVCDPTMLLNKMEWSKLIKKSSLILDFEYILVYILDYAYNPYPKINHIVETIANSLGLPIIVLGENHLIGNFHEKKIPPIGPYEFLYLFEHATFVITNSFHGTAFSLNFNIPFCSVVKDKTSSDSRMYSLLQKVKAEHCALIYDQEFEFSDMILNGKLIKNIGFFVPDFRKYSNDFLSKVLLPLK